MSLVTTPSYASPSARSEPGSHHRMLAELRDQERVRRLLIGFSATVGTVLLLAGLLGAIDFYVELAARIRLLAWAGIAIVVIGLIVQLRRWFAFESVDAVCEAEKQWPEIGQRLRTSHDYQTTPGDVAPADPELVRALESETQQRVTRVDIKPLGRSWPIVALMCTCAVAALLWGVALMTSPEWRVATARLMLMPVEYSTVQMEPLPESVQQGDDLLAQLHVAGRPLKFAVLRYRMEGEPQWNEANLKPVGGELLVNDLSATITDCRHDLQVQIQAGAFDSGIQSVIVGQPLVLEQWNANVKPPEYTGLPAEEGSPAGLRIPAGSTVQLAARYNRQPSQVDVDVTPESVVASATEINEQVTLFSIDASETMDVAVRASASDGMRDDSTLRIDVVPDRHPELKFLAPKDDAEAIPTAELRFTLAALDDYGLTSVGIRYRIDDEPEQTLWETTISESAPELAKSVTLPLEDLQVSYPQAITYYAFATDNRQPTPQRITSELRFVDIRPFSREYEFQESNCSCKGECMTLEKLIKEQRGILGRTFASNQRPDVADGLATRLATEQDDLQSKTESLTVALEAKIGPLPSLTSATAHMTAAIDDLRDSALQDAESDEEHALADLIAARRNLRKILKQSNAQSQMCRNVDQQQMDKIRKPEQERAENEQQQEQQLAELRKKIDELAKQQQSFCKSAKACQNPGQKSSASSSSQSGSPQTSSAPSNPPQSNSQESQPTQPEPSPDSDQTRSELVQQQQQAAQQAREIQDELQSGTFGELAPQRAEQAAESIDQSGKSLSEPGTEERAIAEAQRAAEQLQQLSKHLAQRQHPDFDEKLATAGRLAQQLADDQQRLSESLMSPGTGKRDSQAGTQESEDRPDGDPTGGPQREASAVAEQDRLAARSEELSDLVDQLLAESTEQDWQVQRALASENASNPPRQASSAMQQASQDMRRGQKQAAAANGSTASALLKRFAAGIQKVQSELGPARLAELQKAEKQAASLLEDMQRATNASQQAMTSSAIRQFAGSMHSFAKNDAELAEAMEILAQLNSSPTVVVDGLRDVDEILQRRIQEAILTGALQQAVGAVPPQYSDMVDEYYRNLSKDVE